MPRAAKVAYISAWVLTGLSILSAFFGSVLSVWWALLFAFAAISIHQRRVWGGYGPALVAAATSGLLIITVSRSRDDVPLASLVSAAATNLFTIIVFALAGRSLACSGGNKGLAAPWVLLAALVFIPFVFLQAFVIPTGAMEDTLLIGDRILVRRFPSPVPARGDLVVFRYPVDQRQIFVKRIVGLPGDRIRIANKRLYRNGAPIEERYAVHKTEYIDSYRDNFPSAPNTIVYEPAIDMLEKHVVNGEVAVPEGSYFVLGDNRDLSLDSRYWGFITAGDIIGKPVLVYYSADRLPSQDDAPHTSAPRIRWRRLFKIL